MEKEIKDMNEEEKERYKKELYMEILNWFKK